jgi:hypothetical protein
MPSVGPKLSLAFQLCRRARQAKIRPRSSISLRRRPWKRLARTSHDCRQISMSVPAHGRLYWRSPHLAFVLAPACIVARVTAWSCTDGQDQCRERDESRSRSAAVAHSVVLGTATDSSR